MLKANQLEAQITNELKTLPGDVGLVVKFLTLDKTITYNEQHQFWAASVIKIPIAITFFSKYENNSQVLHQKRKVKPENMVLGSGVVHLLDSEAEYTILDLLKLMIILSDNAATNELLDIVLPEDIEKHMHELGLANTTVRHKMFIKAGKGPNYTTPTDISLLLEKLYKNDLSGSEQVLEIMTETVKRDGIPLYLPNDVRIAHKTGSLPNAVHNVGIVYAKKPFIFAFFSDDQADKLKTAGVLARCAKLCFDFSQE